MNNEPKNTARSRILERVRGALEHPSAENRAEQPAVPTTGRIPPRVALPAGQELELLLAEVRELSGQTRCLAGREELRSSLAELVAAEEVRRAVVWQTEQLEAWGVAAILAELGVEVVPPEAGSRALAACELGITGVDAALAETGTLLLGSGAGRVRAASLLPRVHLAILEPGCLRADLQQALAERPGDRCVTLISGPSRTSDIELTLTIGVHGPKALYVWVLGTG
jgi:L-lactate dehydrogenase complex protein LldG